MKFSLKFILILLVVISSCQSLSTLLNNKIDITGKQIEYRVLSIDSTCMNFYYYISLYCIEKKDTVYLISEKRQCSNSNEVAIGKNYSLVLQSILEYKVAILNNGDTAYNINHWYFDKTKPKYTNSLYTSVNLCGLEFFVDIIK